MRARDLGITIGLLPTGPLNAITDVGGVRVGHATVIDGDGPLVVGRGPVRTGVTVIIPHGGALWLDTVYAGCHRLNGNGELTGLEWIREAGGLSGPVAITNTHSVGTVRDAIITAAVRERALGDAWALPVVGETWDGQLNDIDGQHVRPEHLFQALDAAKGGPVPEGNVGGGTGLICHDFKGGIGTASRVVGREQGGFTVGALVQANYGHRERLAIDGVPVGREIPISEVPSGWGEDPASPVEGTLPAADVGPGPSLRAGPGPGSGSIIVILATDAPLLPHQCERLAQRAGLGVARTGGAGENSSGDLFLAFATGNGPFRIRELPDASLTHSVTTLDDAYISPLFWAAIEATEEAIANALVAAETMTGIDGNTAYAIPHDRLREIFARHRPPAAPVPG